MQSCNLCEAGSTPAHWSILGDRLTARTAVFEAACVGSTPTPPANLSVLVVGLGSIGQRHVDNLHALGIPYADLSTCDSNPALGHSVALEYELGHHPTAVLVCTPPNTHVEIARQALAAGAHVFIEKPIADTLEGVDALLEQAKDAGLVLQVGYNLRYERGLVAIKRKIEQGVIGRVLRIQAEFGQYLPDWRPSQDYRHNYIVNTGIILDASHEIDYVRWLGGEVSRVYCKATRSGTLEMAAEDSASLILTLESGAIAEVHVDCLQRTYTRKCKVVGTDGTLTWQLDRLNANHTYIEEMKDFLGQIIGVIPTVDTRAARVLRIALAAKESSRLGREVAV